MERFSHPKSHKQHLIDQARTLREEAQLLPPGVVRDATIRASRQADTAAYLNEWSNSPGLQTPQ